MINPQIAQCLGQSQFQSPQFLSKYRSTVCSLQQGLQKQLQARNNGDQIIIQAFSNLSPFFRQLAERTSISFAHSIIRSGKIFVVGGRRRIYGCGQKMNNIFLPLLGEFFIKKDRHQYDQQNQLDYLQYLIKKGPNLNNAKKKLPQQRRISIFKQNLNIMTVKAQLQDLFQCDQLCNEGCLMVVGFQEEQYKQSLYTKQQSWIFCIDRYHMKKCCQDEYQRRLLVQINYFRQLSCFDLLQDSQLRDLILKIPLTEMKKDEYVFREGDNSQSMYVLIEGQAKTQRTVQLFKEDPNALYQLQEQASPTSPNSKLKQFAYADFEGVYNYSPVKKKFQLGIIAAVTVFGQEQIGGAQARQVDVVITSQRAKMYTIFVRDLQNLGGKKLNIKQFMDELYRSITLKKIMVRREYLSRNLEFENKRNMNYFFIDSPEAVSPRKRAGSAKQRINNSISPTKILTRPCSPVKPRYTNLNFNQFVYDRKPKASYIKLTAQQDKIAQLTHSVQDIQQKVKAQWARSQRFIFTQKISIASPLFDTNYYRNQRKRTANIQNQKRMQSFAVSSSSSMRHSKIASLKMRIHQF